jgi:ribose transport system substrate-binding protein
VHLRRITATAVVTCLDGRGPVRRAAAALLAVVACAALVAGCGDEASTEAQRKADPAVVAKAQAALDRLSTKTLSKGPNGETAVAADTVSLSPDELEQVKAKGATAAIAMHTGGDDWSRAQINGLRTEFKRLGIKVIAVTDANFNANRQVSDIQAILARKPAIIVSLPVDAVATAFVYREAVKQGVKLVFMDNSPAGMKAGKDFVSTVSADNYGNGVAAAHLMAQQMGGRGTLGLVWHDAGFFVTMQRYEGFKKTIQDEYPGIRIVADKGVNGNDMAIASQQAANAILAKNPDIDAIWGVWDVPAEGILAAARAAGRDDTLLIVTEDLGLNVAISMAQRGAVKALGAQRPFDQGVTEAQLAAYGLLGKKAPAYVALPALPVTQKNYLDAWEQVYHQPPPDILRKAAEMGG